MASPPAELAVDCPAPDEGCPKKKLPDRTGKRAQNSYMFFVASARIKMKDELEGLRVAEQGKLMGERWRAMGASNKAPFVALAEADRARYDAEREADAGLASRRTASVQGVQDGTTEEMRTGEKDAAE